MLKDYVKELCKKKGVSMRQAERDLGFGLGYLSKIDSSTPNAENLQLLAFYFDVPISELSSRITKKKKITAVFRKTPTASDLFASAPVPADGQPEWYTNPETARLAQAAFDRPDLGILMDASADLPPESVLALVEIAKRMKGTND